MYVSEIIIENFRCFGEGEKKLILPLAEGLTALVGENDSGKTAVVDALRLILGTRDQEFFRVEDTDFHWPPGAPQRRSEIRLRCKFDGLNFHDKGSFAEYLTYVDRDGKKDAVFYLNWVAKNMIGARGPRRFLSVEVRSGYEGGGPALDVEARALLRATYLRPLRDAERALSAGRGSRLSQILQYTKEVREKGVGFNGSSGVAPNPKNLSVLGVGDYASALLADREGIREARKRLNESYLKPLSFSGDDLTGFIGVSSSGDEETRLRQLLEKLELELRTEGTDASGNRGLGSNNLLFMACELLLLGSEAADLPLLLIEEPEAHLHPQRQVRLMQFLQNQTGIKRGDGQKIQVIVSTHSPNLASAIAIENLVMLQGGNAFSLAVGRTKLEKPDYRFLQRFLDVTKANLFFARSVIIVEGDGENILLPTLASLIGRDFAEHGVSVVNVGHTGLHRFAKIFQRSKPEEEGLIAIPVACIADMDVMPDCAPEIVGYVEPEQEYPSKRNWQVKSDFSDSDLQKKRTSIIERASGQNVATFVSDEWTLEYDLAFAGLAEDVWIAAHLAKSDDQINRGKKTLEEVEAAAKSSFDALKPAELEKEVLASMVYAQFTSGTKASKSITAQYLAERLSVQLTEKTLTAEALREKLPGYITAAIDHVTINQSKEGDAGTPPQ